MSKSEKPTKGLRGVSIEFAGKHRLLRFLHGLVADFEAEANKILLDRSAIEKGNYMFAEGLMTQWLGDSQIFSLALLFGLKHEDPDLTIEKVNEGIDNYEAGIKELSRNVIEAFRLARDPSSVASLRESWKTYDATQKMIEEAASLQSKTRLAEAQNALTKVQEILASGSKPPDSESN